jgi:RNA polymerase sigma factor (sigma-70 family)
LGFSGRGFRAAQGAVARTRPRFATDDRLVGLVRGGELAAFEILYDRHARELLSFCNYMLGSRQDAEDAVQSTFASAYRALLADERPIEVRPWLFAIARNAALSILRTRRPMAQYAEAELAGADPIAEAEQRESLRQVVATMLELPERQRTALVLAELHGLSQGEIGAVLGVAPEKVKSYIFQARSNLISERNARGTDCREIREELATARGPALLKGSLRRHLRSCEGCRDYAQEVSQQRGQLGALLPLAPSMAFKRRVLDAASGNAAGAGTSAGAVGVGASLAGTTVEIAGGGVKALVAKLLIGAATVGAGTGAGAVVFAAATPSGRLPAHVSPSSGRASDQTAFASAGAAGPSTVLAAGRIDGPLAQPRGPSPSVGRARDGALAAPRVGAAAKSDATRAATSHDHRKSAEETAPGTEAHGAAPGKSAQTHGKSSEAPGHSGQGHGPDAAPGKSGQTHGKSSEAPGHSGQAAEGKSGQSHGNSGHVLGNSGEGRATGTASGKSGQVHGGGVAHGQALGDAQSHASAPGLAQAGAPAPGVNTEKGSHAGSGNRAADAPASSPPAGGEPPIADATPHAGTPPGQAHGAQGAPAATAHEAPEANPHKP